MSLGNITVVGGLIDPRPGKTQYGIHVADRFDTITNPVGSIIISSTSIAGAVLDGVNISTQCRRFQFNGGEIKGCGRYGVYLGNLAVTDTVFNGVHFHVTGSDVANAAAVLISSAQRTTISNCKFTEYERGIQVRTTATRTSIIGNSFADTADLSIYLAADCDIRACSGNDIAESYVKGDIARVASAPALILPIGIDVFFVTGTTTINGISATPYQPYDGREVTLIFEGVVSVTNSGNIRAGGTFSTSDLDVLRLIYSADTSEWLRVAFSAN